jgi:hypothetical protein
MTKTGEGVGMHYDPKAFLVDYVIVMGGDLVELQGNVHNFIQAIRPILNPTSIRQFTSHSRKKKTKRVDRMKELLDTGEIVPGISPYTKRQISLRKLGD